MDIESEKCIPCSGNSYLSEFFDAVRKRDDIRSQIIDLKAKDEEINDKIVSFEKKICEYVQEGMNIAYERLNCDTSILYTLANYDTTGIFLYFKYLSANFYEDPTLKGFSRSKSDNELYFEYGHDRILFIPMEIMPKDGSYNPRDFSDKIIELCKKIVENLQENLKALKFE
jgi:hypothetical protein